MMTPQAPASHIRYALMLAIQRRRQALGFSIERAAERAQIAVEQWQRVELGQLFEDPVVMRAVIAALKVNSLHALISM
jgi:hypothetical protein